MLGLTDSPHSCSAWEYLSHHTFNSTEYYWWRCCFTDLIRLNLYFMCHLLPEPWPMVLVFQQFDNQIKFWGFQEASWQEQEAAWGCISGQGVRGTGPTPPAVLMARPFSSGSQFTDLLQSPPGWSPSLQPIQCPEQGLMPSGCSVTICWSLNNQVLFKRQAGRVILLLTSFAQTLHPLYLLLCLSSLCFMKVSIHCVKVLKDRDSEARQPGCESCLWGLVAMWTWAFYVTSLCLSFSLCKIGIIVPVS